MTRRGSSADYHHWNRLLHLPLLAGWLELLMMMMPWERQLIHLNAPIDTYRVIFPPSRIVNKMLKGQLKQWMVVVPKERGRSREITISWSGGR